MEVSKLKKVIEKTLNQNKAKNIISINLMKMVWANIVLKAKLVQTGNL